MGDADFQRTVDRWLEDNPGRAAKTYRGAVALYHNKLPRELRPYGVMHWFSKTSVASSAPALAYFYGSIAPATAALAAGGIFCAHSAVGVFDRLSKEKVAGPTDNQPEILVRFGDLLTALRANATAAPNKDAAITACLGILEIFARQTTKTKKGEIEVDPSGETAWRLG